MRTRAEQDDESLPVKNGERDTGLRVIKEGFAEMQLQVLESWTNRYIAVVADIFSPRNSKLLYFDIKPWKVKSARPDGEIARPTATPVLQFSQSEFGDA